MNQDAALPAVQLVKQQMAEEEAADLELVNNVKCIQQLARIVAFKPKFHSNRQVKNRFIAVIAISRCVVINSFTTDTNVDLRKTRSKFLVFLFCVEINTKIKYKLSS